MLSAQKRDRRNPLFSNHIDETYPDEVIGNLSIYKTNYGGSAWESNPPAGSSPVRWF
jgi:hypothetical protein